jgi:hypothetical protein
MIGRKENKLTDRKINYGDVKSKNSRETDRQD